MGYFFRRSANLGAFRLNFSKSGIGASVGVKGARLTMTPRGTTYITVGRNGFYYRETISNRTPRSSQTPAAPPTVDSAPSGEIPTVDVSRLVDSSSEQLLNTLNERAHMLNPAWFLYIAALLFVLVIGLQTHMSVSTTSTTPLAGTDYTTLVARYGYPNGVVASDLLGMVTVRTASYTAANVSLVFVQDECTSSYESVTEALNAQKSYPSLAKEEMRRLRPCHAPDDARWVVRQCIATNFRAEITSVAARDGLAGLPKKQTTPPPIEVEKRAGGPSGRGARKTVPCGVLWPATDDVLHHISRTGCRSSRGRSSPDVCVLRADGPQPGCVRGRYRRPQEEHSQARVAAVL
jgi:hypothetical protein